MILRSDISGLASAVLLRVGNGKAARHTDPQHRSIVVLDIAGYGQRDDLGQVRARTGLDRVVRLAFQASGLPWHRLVVKDRGDGMIVLIPATASKAALLNPFVPRLSAGLRDWNAREPGHRMRLRIAVHAGEVVPGPHGWLGSDLNLTCRLVDSVPLRQELVDRPKADLAVIVSEVIHRAVVRHGHRGVAPASFRTVRVAAKEVVTPAWVCSH